MRANNGQILYIPKIGQRADFQHPLMKGCVGWWPLTDGGGGIAKDIVGTNDGTLNGGVSWETDEVGEVAVFDGTSNARISLSSALVSGQTLCFSVWLYIESSTAQRVQIYSSAYAGHVKNQFRFSPLFNYFTFDQYPPGGGGIDTPADTGVEGRWVHAVVTQDSSDTKIYYDGQLKVTGTAETYSGNTPNVFDIGSDNGANSFDGKMQNFRAWNRALSSSEVFELYTNPWSGLSIPSATRYFFVPQLITASPKLFSVSGSSVSMRSNVGRVSVRAAR